MDFQKIEQAMSLAVKIERIAEEVEKLLPELDPLSSTLVMTACNKILNVTKKALLSSSRKMLEEDPELLDRLRNDKDVNKDALDEFLKDLQGTAAADTAADVDFKPIDEK